jgi:pimeloyl-ACP methyl ester carboxylesterase
MKLGRYRFGNPGGLPCLYFHGFPGSGLEPLFLDDLAKEKNLDIYAFDRPGYGDTEAILGFDFSAFYEKILSELPTSPIFVLGVSGGGPFASDFAARFGHRCRGLLLTCPLAGLNDAESFSSFPVAAQWGLKFFSKISDKTAWKIFALESLRRRNLKEFSERFKHRLPEVDRFVFEQGSGFIHVMEKAKQQNFRGCVSDLRFYMNWKPSLHISRDFPIFLFHGLADTIVPSKNTEVYLKYWPWAKAQFYQHDGHFSLPLLRKKEIFDYVHA